MTSCQPYILKAIYQWIIDNEMTPFVTIDAEYLDSKISKEHAEKGIVTLNISATAVKDLNIDDNGISFRSRLGTQEVLIDVQIEAVISIYAREDSGSMVILSRVESKSPAGQITQKRKNKPDLKIIK